MAGCEVKEHAADAPAAGSADAAQADYYRRELSALRAQAQSDIARNYIELQQLLNSGLMQRAANTRRVIRALESELNTLERLGEGLKRWL
jgi:hypothetical protein